MRCERKRALVVPQCVGGRGGKLPHSACRRAPGVAAGDGVSGAPRPRRQARAPSFVVAAVERRWFVALALGLALEVDAVGVVNDAVEYGLFLVAGLVGERAGDERLSRSGRPFGDQIEGLADPVAGGELSEGCAGAAAARAAVDVLNVGEDPDMEYPAFVDGARCCPPEDVGAAVGFDGARTCAAPSSPGPRPCPCRCPCRAGRSGRGTDNAIADAKTPGCAWWLNPSSTTASRTAP